MTINSLDAVLFEADPGCWVAQCLQVDIGAQAATLPGLVHELQRSIVARVAIGAELDEEPFAHLDKAPREYWEKFASAQLKLDAEFAVSEGSSAPTQAVPEPTLKVAA